MVRANTSRTQLKTGATVSLKSIFFASTVRPRGGWKARLLLPGQIAPMDFNGKTPQEVVAAVKQAIVMNGITMSDESIYLNLNMIWMDRIDPKFWLLSREDLASLVEKGDRIQETPVVGKQLTPPSMWGATAWKAMGLLLADEHYTWDNYLAFLRRILSLMNPTTNPLTGCQECYVEFSKEMGILDKSLPLSRDAAREWLFAYHNRVNQRLNKPLKGRAEAWRENHWQ